MTTAIYAFSGDPITYGHINIIERAKKIFDKVIVAIGENPNKKYTFNLAERKEMAGRCFYDPSIKVLSFSNLLVDFAYEQGVSIIIKGVRNADDFNYENILHSVGQSQNLGIDTHILFADPKFAHVSSSAVKAIAIHSGDIHQYVPLHVKQAIEERICGQQIIGVTGEIGCGKSHISKILAEEFDCMQPNSMVHNIELDEIGHQILSELMEPAYIDLRINIAKVFGEHLLDKSNFINRKALGDIVFNNVQKLKLLNKMMEKPISVRLRKEISEKKGRILVNCALLAESNMLHICNNNIILVKVDKDTQRQRLLDRGLTEKQIETRLNCQYNYHGKNIAIINHIDSDQHGTLWTIDNSKDMGEKRVIRQFETIIGELDVWS